MSDVKNKKALKKQEKEEIKAFKKAFKKQTGIESDSKDTGKLVAAFRTQVEQLQKWTVILGKMQPEETEAGRDRLDHWKGRLVTVTEQAKANPKAAAESARNLLPVLLKVVEAVRKKAKSKPSKHQVNGQDVSVYLTDIPGFDQMATNEREEALKVAAEKTAKGLDIYKQLIDDPLGVKEPMPSTPENVEALMWGLKSKAQEKNGGPYQKGAMTVPNGEALRKYLDKCPEVYSRLSSHLREQQGRNKDGGASVTSMEGQTPRGMDFYNSESDSKPGGLPAGMNALLFQQIILPNGGGKALYVKFETEGSFGHPGENRKMDSTVPPDRKKHKNDGARARKHLRNLIAPDKSKEDKDLTGLREQTPKPVVEAAKAVVAAVEGKQARAYLKSSFGTEPKWHLLKKTVPRISLFLAAIDDCYEKHGGEKGWEIGGKAEDLMDKFYQVMLSVVPEDLLDADRRMGGEVVVTDDDMQRTTGQVEEEDPVEEYDGFDDDSDEEDGFDPADAAMMCSDLVEEIIDPTLRGRLGSIYYNELIEAQDIEPFRKFSTAVGKSELASLGDRASTMADRLEKLLARY